MSQENKEKEKNLFWTARIVRAIPEWRHYLKAER